MVAWSVTLADTGKITVGDVATGTSDIVNSSSSITLKATRVDVRTGAMIGGESPNRYRSDNQNYQHSPNRLQKAGMDNPEWTVKGVLDVFTSADLIIYGKLCRMVRTTGYKTFYCANLVEYYKYDENTATISSINVVVSGFNASLSADNSVIEYTLVLRETA